MRADWSFESSSWLKALVDSSQDDVRNAIALINVSRETDIHEFLGCAFYLLCADEKWSGNPSVYQSLQNADALLLKLGIQTLYRLCVQQAQQGRVTVLHTRSTLNHHPTEPPSLAAINPQTPMRTSYASSWSGFPRSWESFVCDAITIRTVILGLGFNAVLPALPLREPSPPHDVIQAKEEVPSKNPPVGTWKKGGKKGKKK